MFSYWHCRQTYDLVNGQKNGSASKRGLQTLLWEFLNLQGKVLYLEMENLCTNSDSSQTRGMDVECPYAERLSVFSIFLNYILNALFFLIQCLICNQAEKSKHYFGDANVNVFSCSYFLNLDEVFDLNPLIFFFFSTHTNTHPFVPIKKQQTSATLAHFLLKEKDFFFFFLCIRSYSAFNL